MSNHHVFRLEFEVATSPLLVKVTPKEPFELDWMEQQVESLEEVDLEESFRVWSVASSEGKLSVVHWFYHHSSMDGESMNVLLR